MSLVTHRDPSAAFRPPPLPLRNFVQDDRVLARLYGANHVICAPKIAPTFLPTPE